MTDLIGNCSTKNCDIGWGNLTSVPSDIADGDDSGAGILNNTDAQLANLNVTGSITLDDETIFNWDNLTNFLEGSIFWYNMTDGTGLDGNASSICSGTTTYLDGENNCDDISSVYEGILNNEAGLYSALSDVSEFLETLDNATLGSLESGNVNVTNENNLSVGNSRTWWNGTCLNTEVGGTLIQSIGCG